MRDRYRALIQKHTPLKTSTAKYAFTEDGSECPFTSTTAESSAVTPTLSRVNSHAFTIKALLHCATPVQSTKYRRVDGNPTGLFGTHRGAKHIRAPDPVTVANMYVRWPKEVRSHNASRHGIAMSLPTSELDQSRWTLQYQTVQAKPPEMQRNFNTFSTARRISAGILPSELAAVS